MNGKWLKLPPRAISVALFFGSLSLACSGGDSPPIGAKETPVAQTDASASSPAPVPQADAAVAVVTKEDPPAVDAGPLTPSGTCDLGAAPAGLPTFHGKLVIRQAADSGASDAGLDSGAPPLASGEEKGVWVFEDLTVYLDSKPGTPPSGIDTSKSSIVGQGYVDFGEGKLRLSNTVDISIAAGASGNIVQTDVLKLKGAYTIATSGLVSVTPECAEGGSGKGDKGSGASGELTFARTSATHGQLTIRTPSATLVADLVKAP